MTGVPGGSVAEMRGVEGARRKKVYHGLAAEYGVRLGSRDTTIGFDNQSSISQKITALYQVLYRLSGSAVLGLGLVPALGFIHLGHT